MPEFVAVVEQSIKWSSVGKLPIVPVRTINDKKKMPSRSKFS